VQAPLAVSFALIGTLPGALAAWGLSFALPASHPNCEKTMKAIVSALSAVARKRSACRADAAHMLLKILYF